MDPNAIASQATGGGGPASEQMAREVSVMLSANTGPYQQEMKRAADETNKLADALHNVEKAYVGTLKFIGKSAIGMGATMQASAAGAVWSAAQFEESFARVAKTTGLQNESVIAPGHTGRMQDFAASLGLGDNALQTFQNDIRGLSTEIPVSVQELSYLADIAGTLGVESDNLVLFADTAAKLGAAINDLGSDQAIAGLANLIGAFGRAEEEVTNLGSSLADLANHTRGNASEILQFSDRLAGTAVQVGMTAEEVMGLGAAVSAIGAEPQLGASAIVQAMNTISVAVQGGGSDLDNFARAMGMASDDLKAMWTDDGPTAVLTKLLSSLNQQGEEAVVTLRSLGLSGVGTTQILGGLAAQLGTYNDAMETSVTASEKGSAVAELAAVRFDTVYKAMQRFGQSTAEVFRSVGVGFLAPFKVLIDFATGFVNIFNKIPQPLKTVLGLLLGLGGAVMTAAGAFTLFFAKFHALFALLYGTPILLRQAVKGLEKLGEGASLASKHLLATARHLDRIGNFFAAIPQKLKMAGQAISEKGLIGAAIDGFQLAKEKVQAFYKALVAPRVLVGKLMIAEVFEKVWPRITGGLSATRKALAKFSSDAAALLSRAFVGAGSGLVDFRKYLGKTFNDALLMIGVFASQSARIFDEFKTRAMEAFTTLRANISDVFSRMFSGSGGEGAGSFARFLDFIRSGMGDVVRYVSESTKDVREALGRMFAGGLPGIIKSAKELAVRIRASLVDGLAAITGGLDRAMPNVAEFARNMGGRISGALRKALDDGVPRLLDWARNTPGDLVAAFQLGFEELGKRLKRTYTRALESLIDTYKEVMPRLSSGIASGFSRISESVKAALAEMSPAITEWARTSAANFGSAFAIGLGTLRTSIKRHLRQVIDATVDALDVITPLVTGAFSTIGKRIGPPIRSAFSSLADAFGSFRESTREMFSNLLTAGSEAFDRMLPRLKAFGKVLLENVLKGLEAVGRAAKWVFDEFFVKETIETMKDSLRKMGLAASWAAKPFVALGKSMKESVGKSAAETVANMRDNLRLLVQDGSAAGFTRALTMMGVQADALKANFAASFPALSRALAQAKLRAVEFGSAMKASLGPAMVNAVAAVKTQMAALGVTMKMMLGPIGLILGAVVAVSGALWGWDKWKSRNEEITDSLFSLADAAGLVTDEIERMSWATANSGLEEMDMAVSGRNVISQLRGMSVEGQQNLSFSYAASLVRGGQEPERVAEHVNELRRLAGLSPIVFEYTFRDLSSGEGYEEWLESTRDSVQGLFDDRLSGQEFDGPLENSMAYFGRTPEKLDEAFQDTIRQMKAVGDSNMPALIALMGDMESSIDEAVASGQLGPDVGENLRRDMLAELKASLPSQSDISGFRRGAAKTLDLLSMGIFSDTDWIRESTTGFGSQQDWIANLVGDPDNQDTESLSHVFETVKEVTGATEDLDDAVRNLDGAGFLRLQDALADAALEIQNEKLVDAIDAIDTRLGKQLFDAQMTIGAENLEKVEQHILSNYHHQVGHVRAIEEMNTELDRAIDKYGQWDRRTQMISETMREIQEQYAEIQMNELQIELTDISPMLHLQEIQDRIRSLTDEPHNIQLLIELQGEFEQTYHQQVQSFRQTMQQYDQLIEQREETVRSHNERLEKMQENHDRNLKKMDEQRLKSIDRANEQYEKRLEDIEKAEKKAFENRIEQQAKAFNILERVQATPTADMGAMLSNMQAQNAAMEEMTQGLAQLRDLGVNEEILEAIGLNDPRNFNQVRRMLEMAVSDPAMIDQINAEWARRLDLSEAFVQEADTSQITEQFDEQRENAKEALDEQLIDIEERFQESLKDTNESYSRSVDEANEANERQLENIADNLAKLGEDTFETLDELLERALGSHLEHLIAAAEQIEHWRERLEWDAIPATGSPVREAAQRRDEERENQEDIDMLGLSQRSAMDIGVGFSDGLPVTWQQLRRDIYSGAGGVLDPLEDEIHAGVGRSQQELADLADQDFIWDRASSAGVTGARRLSTDIAAELERGTADIRRPLEIWSGSAQDYLNPLLESVGSDPLELTVTRGQRADGARYAAQAADGGVLPNQATIQRPGTLVQWAEPETGGEAFIPLASSKRQRSKQIWERTGELLGIDMNKLDPHALSTYADGGFHNIPDMSDLGTLGAATEKAMEYVYKKMMKSMNTHDVSLGKGEGAGAISGGWQQMWAALKSAFPNANLMSGFRPGAITATGNRSYHGMGRAIDVTPSTDIANWIRKNYMERTREMIYSPMNSKQIHNGNDHYYDTPITRAQHWDHVHWAMAMGDVLTDEMKRGVDKIPALLSNGEFVMQADAVKEYGLEQMEAINARKFAKGGPVGSMPRTRGREPSGGGQTDLVNALTKALANASMGRSETNNWDVKVEAQDTRTMIRELEQKKRLSRLTRSDQDV